MRIEILGACCTKCRTLAANVEKAVQEAGLTAEIVKVTDPKKISEYGVMTIPALVVDGTVTSVGRVLSVADLMQLLENEQGHRGSASGKGR